MTDYSKLFSDPSSQAYDVDPHEAAQWQAAATNPFAVMHALAARRNANNRRDQYGEQLAAHDERAVAGTSALEKDAFKRDMALELAKVKELDPSFAMDYATGGADVRMANGEIDPRVREGSHAYQMMRRSSALADYGKGMRDLGEIGLRPSQASTIPQNLHLGDLRQVSTPGERQENAKGVRGKFKVIQKPILGKDATEDLQVESNFNSPQERDQYLKTITPQTKRPPPPPGGGDVPTNAKGGAGGPELRGAQDAEPPGPPVPVKTQDQLSTLPSSTQAQLNKLNTGGIKGMSVVPRTLHVSGTNVYFVVQTTEGGRTTQRRAMIDGRGNIRVE